MIPKKIHYVWLGGQPYSDLMERCFESWRVHAKEYEIILWDESNIPRSIPYIEKAIEAKQYAFASDYVRFYALYHEGGIYLDVDMELVKAPDKLLGDDFFAGRESDRWISAGIIGSAKGNPLLLEIMKEMEKRDSFETIPKIMTPIIEKHYQDDRNGKIKIYPSEYFYPYPMGRCLMASDIKVETYAIHHWARSWNPELVKSGTGVCVALKKSLGFFKNLSKGKW